MLSFIPSFEELKCAFSTYSSWNDTGISPEDRPIHPIKINTKELKLFNVDSNALERISNFLSNATLREKTFIHRKQSQLPFSLAYNPFDGKVFLKTRGLPPVGFGGSANLVSGVDLETRSRVVCRSLPSSKVSKSERDINIDLSRRPDLFVATKEIYDYRGSFKLKDEENEYEDEIFDPLLNKRIIDKTCFVLECLDIDLLELSNSEDPNFQGKFEIVCEIAKALDVLHNEFNIVHRDLKLENIFISKGLGGKKYCVKIGDFGQSEYADRMPEAGGGTFNYNPPEWVLLAYANVKNGTEGNLPKAEFPSDMWNFGVAILLLFGDRLTFNLWEELCEKHKIISKDFPFYRKKVISSLEDVEDERLDKIIELTYRCLEVNPETRISAREALAVLGISQDVSGLKSAEDSVGTI